jgi:hypothetical protein
VASASQDGVEPPDLPGTDGSNGGQPLRTPSSCQ